METNIEKKPFTPYLLEEERNNKEEVLSLKLNQEERKVLNECKSILEQDKDSTALKQLMFIASKVLRDDKMAYILGVVYSNKRKNKRLGIIEFEQN
jgi:hypothetical protein